MRMIIQKLIIPWYAGLMKRAHKYAKKLENGHTFPKYADRERKQWLGEEHVPRDKEQIGYAKVRK